MSRIMLACLGLLLLAPVGAFAQNPTPGPIDQRCTTPSDRACVDWDKGVAIAVGTGAPASFAQNAAQKNISALRAARLDAARNLLELIKGVNISSSSTVQSAMVASDTVNTQIEGTLNGLREVAAPKYFSDGSIQIRLETSLRQVIPQSLYVSGPPQELGGSQAPSAPVSSVSSGGAYTGLIIDARGTGVVPAMSPKVLDPQGKEVYGSSFVSREFAISQGMVGYVKSVDAARNNDRVKGNPALIKAVEAKGANKADLVVSQDDANTLKTLAQQQTFMRESRVMIVLD